MRLSLLRPEDLLVLDVELVNLLPSADGMRAEREDADADAYVLISFPPQAVAEPVWPGPTVDAPPIRTVLAGPSRLVFRVPPGIVVPLTVEGLLAWEAWEPVLAPTALPRTTAPSPAIPPPAMPSAFETAIELPYRLVLSPDAHGRWRTGGSPTTSGLPLRQQLWSAILHDGTGAPADVRALARHTGPRPFESSLDALADTRGKIVQLTSDFHLPVSRDPAVPPFTPVPMSAKHLELTALGANAELDAAWEFPLVAPEDLPDGFVAPDLVEYQHIAALGRDHLVRTVTVGYLCPTGHRAVVVTTIERLPLNPRVVAHAPDGALFGAGGYLVKTAQVIVQQPVVDYSPLVDAFAHDGRELPWKRIRITTKSARITLPPPPPPPPPPGEPPTPTSPFWLLDPDGQALLFHAVATDVTNADAELALPLMFVPYSSIGCHRDIRAVFDNSPFPNAKTITLTGQPVAFAPPGTKPGSTTLKTDRVGYDIEQPWHDGHLHPEHTMDANAAPPSYVPRFLPRITVIRAAVPAVDDLLGTAEARHLVLDPVYLQHGLDSPQNDAQAFANFVTALPFSLSTQLAGGLANPTSVARALSRSMGPVDALDQLQAGTVDLSSFTDTKLLGTIRLLDLVDTTSGFDVAASGSTPSDDDLDNPNFRVNPPRITSRRLPDGVESRFIWKPPLGPGTTIGIFTIDTAVADLLLDATTRLSRDGSASSRVIGRLRNVTLTFAEALSVTIGELSFRSEGGRKMEVGAKDVQIAFDGPLEFVNNLKSIIPESGFDDPPSLLVDAQGAVVGYSLGVPDVGVGIFSLQNITLSAALSIPFTDRPAGVRFAVSERHKPFLITVSLFGGGGFFSVAVSTKGLEQVEASLEFGANISINLGLASGGVSVMAGIYFGMKGSSVELTGYLRCGGYVDVLGIISISLEFYLAFTYRDKAPGNEVWGQASLTVSVKIAFFSKSVTLSVERHFAGSDGDPSFQDTVSAPEWAGYLQTFA